MLAPRKAQAAGYQGSLSGCAQMYRLGHDCDSPQSFMLRSEQAVITLGLLLSDLDASLRQPQ